MSVVLWATTSMVLVLTPGLGGAAVAGSRDRIAYHARTPKGDQVYTADLRGQHRRRLTRAGMPWVTHSNAVWSPHGARLLYLRTLDFDANGDLWVMGARGRHKRLLLRGGEIRGFMDMSWAPGAGRIALAVVDEYTGRQDVAIYHLHTHKLRTLRALKDPRWHVVDVDWAPHGQRLIFSAWAENGPITNYELFSVRSDGSGLRRLTITPKLGEYGATWSPNGARIAFTRAYGRCTRVLTSTPAVAHVHRVTSACGATEPEWAPRGHRIVTSTFRTGVRSDIAVMRLDGSHRTFIAQGYAPSWRPR